jgi:alpha-beta hydrolase superfamily lysophospholipase
MTENTFTLVAEDHHTIFVRHWQPAAKTKIKGVIHISHGMAEHSARYTATAHALNKKGFLVYAHDHRGHGHSASGILGHYADSNGWKKVVGDFSTVQKHIITAHPELPKFLLGHSMGSFITMAYLRQPVSHLNGVIISGSNFDHPAKYKALKPVIRAEVMRQGATGRSPILEFLTFGSFNKPFDPPRTKFDWLSKDASEVDKYVNDPLSGFFCTNKLWEDLVQGLISISTKASFDAIEHKLPIYFFAGDHDPVGQYGKGVAMLAQRFIASAHQDVSLKLYPGGRHEMLNETNASEVINDIVAWLKHRID